MTSAHSNPPPMALNPNKCGKQGELNLRFEVDEGGRTILRSLFRKAPTIVQQALYWETQLPRMACIYTLSSGGAMVDGDRYCTHIHLGKECEVHIASGAATRVATMKHDHVEVAQTITLDNNSYLEWLPELTIPCAHARLHTSTEIVVASSAALFWAEPYSCGRLHSGERFDFDEIRQRVVLRRPEGSILARESAVIIPQNKQLDDVGILGSFTHWATIFMVAPSHHITSLCQSLRAYYTTRGAMGVLPLASNEGIVVRLLGHSSGQLKSELRRICSRFREQLKGVAMDADFPWR